MTTLSSSRVVWILGLLHSGITIFWNSFRKDHRFICFDEPFTGNLGSCFPEKNKNRTFDELIMHFSGSPEEFPNHYEPVELWQELATGVSPKQERYHSVLLCCGERVVINEMHLHLHLPALSKLAPGSRVIHLHRRASTLATSHLLPSSSTHYGFFWGPFRAVWQIYRKHIFFSRDRLLSGMRRESVIGRHFRSKFKLLLDAAGYDSEKIMAGSAPTCLLAYWHYHSSQLVREGPQIFGERFRSVNYEKFASSPREALFALYGWMDMASPSELSYMDMHRPKQPHRARDPSWRHTAREGVHK